MLEWVSIYVIFYIWWVVGVVGVGRGAIECIPDPYIRLLSSWQHSDKQINHALRQCLSLIRLSIAYCASAGCPIG